MQLRHYLSVDDISKLTGKSRRTVQRWLTRGLIPSFRIGGGRFVEARDLEALVERAKQVTA